MLGIGISSIAYAMILRYSRPKDSGAYVPACAAGLSNDPNLTDGMHTREPRLP